MSSALRKFVRQRESEERCDTCGEGLAAEHPHTLETATRRIRCACPSCAELYRTVYRTIPNRVNALPDFQIDDAQWRDLMIPIGLAFFWYSSTAEKTVALYPGPAGTAETTLPQEAWESIASGNACLERMQPDVEALLANRVGGTREYLLVPIDECYKLTGLIRTHWRGLSGGAVVWGEIAHFFDGLRKRSEPCPA